MTSVALYCVRQTIVLSNSTPLWIIGSRAAEGTVKKQQRRCVHCGIISVVNRRSWNISNVLNLHAGVKLCRSDVVTGMEGIQVY